MCTLSETLTYKVTFDSEAKMSEICILMQEWHPFLLDFFCAKCKIL